MLFVPLFLLLLSLECWGELCNPVNLRFKDGKIISAAPDREIFCDSFEKESSEIWSGIFNHGKYLKMEHREFLGRQALVISNQQGKRTDTGFCLKSRIFPVQDFSIYRVEFWTAASKSLQTEKFGGYDDQWNNYIYFYDRQKKVIDKREFRYGSCSDKFRKVLLKGVIPSDAFYMSMNFAGDWPDFLPGQFLSFAGLCVSGSPKNQNDWSKESSFVSDCIIPYSPADRILTWNKARNGGKVYVQLAFAPDVRGFPGHFTDFQGPDGTGDTWYSKKNTQIPATNNQYQWVRYRVRMKATEKHPVLLRSISIGKYTDKFKHSSVLLYDSEAPVTTLRDCSPLEDGKQPLYIDVKDCSGINWNSLDVRLDQKDLSERCWRSRYGFSIRPGYALAEGIHKLDIKVSDLHGNENLRSLYFRVGPRKKAGRVCLREDGMTLVHGKPFFPIGVYFVTENKHNNRSLENAFSELRSAGVNLVHTYAGDHTWPRFMNLAEKHGLRVLLGRGNASIDHAAELLEKYADHPSLLAWYAGDDTSAYCTPRQLRDLTDVVHSLAPHLLPVHADALSRRGKGVYSRYASACPVFMPELYPIESGDQQNSRCCVAEVARDVRNCIDEGKKQALTSWAIWPVIQYFRGWGSWKRFPTQQELKAMSFAAILSGAQGIVWYTYHTSENGQGISQSEENWRIFSSVSRQIADYAPIFLQPKASRGINIRVMSGSSVNCCGQPSVLSLTKKYEGRTYLFALNTVKEKIRVEYCLQGYDRYAVPGQGECLLERENLVSDMEPYELKVLVLR